MDKQRNYRNWAVLVLIMTGGLVLGLKTPNWPISLLFSAMVALLSYWVLARLNVL